MGFTDQIKYAKILYLADVLGDIHEEMEKCGRYRNFTESIQGIVKDLRATVLDPMQNAPGLEEFELKRLEHKYRTDVSFVPEEEFDRFVNHLCRGTEEMLLKEILKGKMIHTTKHVEDNRMMTITSSLIVGIERKRFVVEPQVTFMDNLLKRLDEEKNK